MLATITTRTIPILMVLFVVGVLVTTGSVIGFLVSEEGDTDVSRDGRHRRQ